MEGPESSTTEDSNKELTNTVTLDNNEKEIEQVEVAAATKDSETREKSLITDHDRIDAPSRRSSEQSVDVQLNDDKSSDSLKAVENKNLAAIDSGKRCNY